VNASAFAYCSLQCDTSFVCQGIKRSLVYESPASINALWWKDTANIGKK